MSPRAGCSVCSRVSSLGLRYDTALNRGLVLFDLASPPGDLHQLHPSTSSSPELPSSRWPRLAASLDRAPPPLGPPQPPLHPNKRRIRSTGGCRASASRVRQKPSAVAVAVAPLVRLINVGHLGYVFCCCLGLVCGSAFSLVWAMKGVPRLLHLPGWRRGLWNIGTTRRAVWSMSVRVMMSSDPT